MKSLYTLAALAFVGCATTSQVDNSSYRIETPVLVNGREVARTSSEIGSTGRCVENVALHTDPEDQRIQYSVLERLCDNNNDGLPDFGSYSRIGRGEALPHTEHLVISMENYLDDTNTMRSRGNDCLVLEYAVQGNSRILSNTSVVKCNTLSH